MLGTLERRMTKGKGCASTRRVTDTSSGNQASFWEKRGDLRTCKGLESFPMRHAHFNIVGNLGCFCFERQRHGGSEQDGEDSVENLQGDVAETLKLRYQRNFSALGGGHVQQVAQNNVEHPAHELSKIRQGTPLSNGETIYGSKELLSCCESQSEDHKTQAKGKKLDSKEGANDIYNIAKARERRRRDLGNVRYIKDEGGRTIVREEDIRKRWGEYFYNLFNKSSPEVRKKGAASPHLAPRLLLTPVCNQRCLKDKGVKWLTCLFNKIFSSAKMPDEWRLSEVIPIYKNKGDVQACGNYKGIKLLSHTMKLWERVIERELKDNEGDKNQFGLCREGLRPRLFTFLEALWKSIGKDKETCIWLS
ncbi:hypothetical protein Tco_1185722 [Tanacetum coccineum]